MRFRTKLFVIWGCVVLVLWAGIGWSVRSAIQSSFDHVSARGFAGARQDLHRQQAERVRGMRQAAAMVMNIPELRALIAEHNFEVSSENLDSLQERLDNLAQIVGVSFVCVLDARGNVIAQNHNSPWKTLGELGTFLKNSPSGTAMVNSVFRAAPGTQTRVTADAFGMWSYQQRLFQVVGVPLVFNSDGQAPSAVDGALVMAAPLTDALAVDLAQSHNCQVTFLADGHLVACSLPPALKGELQTAYQSANWRSEKSFDVLLGGVSYRSSIENIVDPCSGSTVGAILIQSDLKDARTAHDSVSKRLTVSMVGGLFAAALASFFVSAAVTRPVRELSRGVKRLAEADLDVSIVVHSKDELGALASAFNDMVRQLRARRELERLVEESRAMSEAKSQFLATMSHEIRTPLNGVIGMADLLLRTPLDARQKKYAGLVKSSAEVLTTLINDILDFSKMEAGKMELESVPFNLHDLTEDIVELLALKGLAKGLQIVCDIGLDVPQWVRGDSTRLRQIIVNLVNNAVKFTDAGEVVVSVAREDCTPQRLRIEVRDTGIGIPPERMDRLFQSFSQVDASTTRRFGGTGLGLAICKQLVELMGGVISVKSEAGVGSTFSLSLPLEPHQQENATPETSTAKLQELAVLVVDANASCRRYLCKRLQGFGINPLAAASASEAIEILSLDPSFRVVVLDQATAEQDRAKLDAHIARCHAAIVMLVPLGSEQAFALPSSSQRINLVTKPVRWRQLRDAILSAVGAEKAQPAVADRKTAAAFPQPCVGRVLVAEDNEINQMVVAHFMKGAGLECEIVVDGRAAVAAFERGSYDVILMDCQMPIMDGYAATREIRRLEAKSTAGKSNAKRMAIIALTANTGLAEREKCREAGMDAHVDKPFNGEQLFRAMQPFLPARESSPRPRQDAPPSNSPAAPAAFDVEAMLARCSGNASLVISVLKKFEDQSSKFIESIRHSLSSGEFEEIARASHRLKGTAGILFAAQLADLAARVETMCRDGQTSDLADEVERLNQEIRKTAEYAGSARSTLLSRAENGN